jgi:hypothetical protein
MYLARFGLKGKLIRRSHNCWDVSAKHQPAVDLSRAPLPPTETYRNLPKPTVTPDFRRPWEEALDALFRRAFR